MPKLEVIVGNDGSIRGVYDDALLPVLTEGKVTTRRVSHVEPDGNGWKADMSPIDGPMLGPYDTRAAALKAEHDWLINHDIPIPENRD